MFFSFNPKTSTFLQTVGEPPEGHKRVAVYRPSQYTFPSLESITEDSRRVWIPFDLTGPSMGQPVIIRFEVQRMDKNNHFYKIGLADSLRILPLQAPLGLEQRYSIQFKASPIGKPVKTVNIHLDVVTVDGIMQSWVKTITLLMVGIVKEHLNCALISQRVKLAGFWFDYYEYRDDSDITCVHCEGDDWLSYTQIAKAMDRNTNHRSLPSDDYSKYVRSLSDKELHSLFTAVKKEADSRDLTLVVND